MTDHSLSTCSPSPWLAEHPKLGIALIDHLFNRLDGAYPNRWRAAFASPNAIKNWRETWSEAFDDEGLTPDTIGAGLRACRKQYDWPPSLSEFIKACKPPINIDIAVYEAIEQMRVRVQGGADTWSSPAIYWAADKIGAWDLAALTFSQIKPRFESALKKVLELDPMPPIPAFVPALMAPGKAESTREYGRKRLEELGASGVLRSESAGKNIGWARRILAEDKETGKVTLNKLRITQDAIENVTGVRPS